MYRTFITLAFLLCRLFGADPEELATRGEFDQAAILYLEQARVAEADGSRNAAIMALMNAAGCMKMSGDISAAALHVETVGGWLGEDPPPGVYLEWLALKGSILSLGKRPAGAIEPLREALELVTAHGDPLLGIDLLNDLGIALSATGKHADAMAVFERSGQLADQHGSGGKSLRANQNRLVAAFQAWADEREIVRRIDEFGARTEDSSEPLRIARDHLDSSLNAAIAVLPGHDPGGILALHLRLTAAMAAHRGGAVATANQLFGDALDQARASGDPGFEASALLGLAEQYIESGRAAEALRLLDEARPLRDALDEIEGARHEVLTAEARCALDPTAAITGDAIRRAVASVENIRSDLARSQLVSDLGRGFREFAGRPYLLLADHLLRGGGGEQENLRAARDAVEAFKTWELNDFYRDDCVNLALTTARDLDRIGDPSVAVLYVIPLDDRTEILLGHDSGLHRFTSPAKGPDLLATARRFRYQLESDYGTYGFRDDAEFLHAQLIRPTQQLLQSLGVRHLVFVPDGALGNIPLGAFYDASTSRYLIEDYSVSIAPNLSLLGDVPPDGKARPMLAGGLSESVQGFSAIPAVAAELDAVAGIYPDRVLLEDRAFTTAAIRENLLNLPADVVHFASHGEFLGRAEGSFLLTHDGRITLDQLEEMIRPKKYVGTPVGLLCLSACRTAAGDDRAALGLAGASVKSGARSVLATLWYVNDIETARVMSDFHRRLRANPDAGKAAALREAQLEILRADHGTHPSLWAPFVLVGAWQ